MENNPDALTQLLLDSINTNTIIRTKAQEEINNLTNNNLNQFILELSKKQSNEKELNTIRQLCATLIKNIIRNSENNWLNLDINLRNEIKNNENLNLYLITNFNENNLKNLKGFKIKMRN